MELNLTGRGVPVASGSEGIGLASAAGFAVERARYVNGAAATVA